MTNLVKFESSNILYNQSFFDLKTVQSFLNMTPEDNSISKAKTSLKEFSTLANDQPAPAQDASVSGITDTMSLEDIIEKTINESSKDPELAKEISISKEKLKKELSNNLTAALTSEIDPKLLKHNLNSFSLTEKECESGIDYFINNEHILHIPTKDAGSPLAVSFEMIIAWTMLIWHSISFIATVVSIWMPKADGKRVSEVGKVVQKEASYWRRFIDQMKRIKDAVDANEKVQCFIEAFKKINVFLQFKNVVKSILSNLKWYEITLAVMQFICAVAALFVTAGASLVAKLIKLASNLISIVQDVIAILKLEGKLSLKDSVSNVA